MRAKKCIILNGPPGSGKDTLARLLGMYGYTQCENKSALFDIACAMTGMSKSQWFDRYNDRALKEQKWDTLNGMSQREFLIWISEEVVKPRLGKGQFGVLATRNALSAGGDVVFSDGGFQEEMFHLQEAFGIENVYLVHLHRRGHSFAGDSRNYLMPVGSPHLDLEVISGRAQDAINRINNFVAGY